MKLGWRARFLVLAAALAGCAGLTLVADRYDEIDAASAIRLTRVGALVLDVRPPDVYSTGHAAGALSIPLSQLWARMDELPPRYDAEIVLYDDDASRQERAAVKLKDEGYFRVHLVRGGFSAWAAAGGPVSDSPAPPAGFGRGVETWPGG